MCKDYISEKFWAKAMSRHVVPVVMGPPREDYEKVAPPNSFIHVDDFGSVQELAQYLLKLSKNDTLYGKYIRWMSASDNKNNERNSAASSMLNGICALCEKVKRSSNQEVKSEVVMNLDSWWFGKGYSHNNEQFPICSSKSSASGYPLRWYITAGYNALVLTLCLLWTTSCCKSVIRDKKCLSNK